MAAGSAAAPSLRTKNNRRVGTRNTQRLQPASVSCMSLSHYAAECLAVGDTFSFQLMVAQVLGLCLNRGPLCEPLNLVQFFAVFTLPITPQAIFNGASLPPLLAAPHERVLQYVRKLACTVLCQQCML